MGNFLRDYYFLILISQNLTLDIFIFTGLIKQVVQHSAQLIYTRVTKDEETE